MWSCFLRICLRTRRLFDAWRGQQEEPEEVDELLGDTKLEGVRATVSDPRVLRIGHQGDMTSEHLAGLLDALGRRLGR